MGERQAVPSVLQCLRRSPQGLLVAALLLASLATSIPAYLRLTRSQDGSEYFYWYGFQDRRWIVALYFIWVVGLPLLILLLARVAGVTRSFEFLKKSQRTHLSLSLSELVKRSVLFLVLGGLAWIQWGPPWGGPAMHGGVDIHETVHLKGYQGILTGSQPYIGAGGEQYGPLSQLFVSEWIQRFSGVSLSGIREAYAAQNFTAVLFIILILVVFLRPKVSFFAVIIGVFLAPRFSFFAQTSEGMTGFFGWANLWRYSGILLLGLAIPWLLVQARGSRWRAAFGVLMGLVWGMTTLFAQENLLGGLLVLGAIAASVVLARIATIRAVLAVVASIMVGLIGVWITYLIPYVASGATGDFFTSYFLFPSAVSSGYTGSSWSLESPLTAFFFLVPVLMCVGGVTLALAMAGRSQERDTKTMTDRMWLSSWLVAFGLFAASAVSYAGVLNRSDGSHLGNSAWLFPFFIVVFVAWALEHQRMSPGRSVPVTAVSIVGVWLVVLAIGLQHAMPFYPSVQRFAEAVESRLVVNGESPIEVPGRIDAPLDPSAPALGIGQDVTRLEAQRFSAEVKSLAGERPTYIDYSVSGTFGALTTGYWYFAADLDPAELPFEEDHMEISTRERQRNIDALKDPGNPVDVLVTSDPDTEKSQAVLGRGGFDLVGQLRLNGAPVLVFSRT